MLSFALNDKRHKQVIAGVGHFYMGLHVVAGQFKFYGLGRVGDGEALVPGGQVDKVVVALLVGCGIGCWVGLAILLMTAIKKPSRKTTGLKG